MCKTRVYTTCVYMYLSYVASSIERINMRGFQTPRRTLRRRGASNRAHGGARGFRVGHNGRQGGGGSRLVLRRAPWAATVAVSCAPRERRSRGGGGGDAAPLASRGVGAAGGSHAGQVAQEVGVWSRPRRRAVPPHRLRQGGDHRLHSTPLHLTSFIRDCV